MHHSGRITLQLVVICALLTLLAVCAIPSFELVGNIFPDTYPTEQRTVEKLLAGEEVSYREAVWLLENDSTTHHILDRIVATSNLDKREVFSLAKERYKVRYDATLEVAGGN